MNGRIRSTSRAALPSTLMMLLAMQPACYTARVVPASGIQPNARVELVFPRPTDVVVTRPEAAADTLRGVRVLQARYHGAAGDTVVLRDLTYVDRHGIVQRTRSGAELRFHRTGDRIGRDAEIRQVRFSPGRTIAAVTLPILLPIGFLALLLSL